MHVLVLGGGSCNFQPCFRGGSVIFVPTGGGGPCVFYQPHFQMLRPTPLPYFLTSPLREKEPYSKKVANLFIPFIPNFLETPF